MTDANENTVTAADHENIDWRARIMEAHGKALDAATSGIPSSYGAVMHWGGVMDNAIDALRSEHAAELARAQQDVQREIELRRQVSDQLAGYWRERNEARAENERLRHRIDYLLRTDPSEWEPEVIRWLSPAALAAAQEPPAEGGDR